MSPVYIKTRVGKSGKRYLVYWRRGGRSFAEQYAGSFKTKKEASIRRDLVAGELASGRDPQLLLEALKLPPVPKPGLATVWPVWARSRKDVGDSARKLYSNSKDRWLPILGETTDPAAVTVEGVIAGIDEMLDDLAPNTVRLYLSHLAMVLDFADVVPNPARSQKIKLPTGEVEKTPPTNEEWAAILNAISDRSRLAVRLMECDALRVSETCGIESGDIDMGSGQILIRRSVTKTRAGRRWVPTPDPLLEELAENSGVTVTPSLVNYDLRAACRKAKLREYGTHALRHRRISLWIRQGIDPVQVARWAGHSKASESTDTYGHTVVDALSDEWLSFWMAAYSRSGAAQVRHEGVTE